MTTQSIEQALRCCPPPVVLLALFGGFTLFVIILWAVVVVIRVIMEERLKSKTMAKCSWCGIKTNWGEWVNKKFYCMKCSNDKKNSDMIKWDPKGYVESGVPSEDRDMLNILRGVKK